MKKQLGDKIKQMKSEFQKVVSKVLNFTNVTPFRLRMHSFSCAYCAEEMDRGNIVEHTRKMHFAERLSISRDARYLANVLHIKVDIENLQCSKCFIILKDLVDMKRHIIEDHDAKIPDAVHNYIVPFVLSKPDAECVICNTVFASYRQLSSHMNSHVDNFTCDECEATFLTRARLSRHKTIEHLDAPYMKISKSDGLKCATCDIPFENATDLRAHREEMHIDDQEDNGCTEGDQGKYECDLCGEYFPTKLSLRQHVNKHRNRQKDIDGEIEAQSINSLYNEAKESQEDFFLRRRKFLDLTKLILTNTNATPFKNKSGVRVFCLYCKEGFIDYDTFVAHNVENHRQNRHAFAAKENININGYVRVDIQNLRCETCGMKLYSYQDMIRHFKEVHQEAIPEDFVNFIVPYDLSCNSCVICSKEFETFAMLDLHMNDHCTTCQCPVCERTFMSVGRLKTHLRLHTQTRRSVCPICKQSFATLKGMNYHVKAVHEKNVSFKCHICQEEFDNYHKRNSHYSRVHGTAERRYDCKICGKSYVAARGLQLHHQSVHMKQKPYMCKQCGLTFKRKDTLKKHEEQKRCMRGNKKVTLKVVSSDGKETWIKSRKTQAFVDAAITILTNSNATPFQSSRRCSYCKYNFDHIPELLEHTRTEHFAHKLDILDQRHRTDCFIKVDVEDLMCTACKPPKSVQNLEVLCTHLSDEHGLDVPEKIYNYFVPFRLNDSLPTCVICQDTFETFKDVTSHMNTHTDNVRCQICNETFYSKNILIGHMTVCHSDPGPFLCEICSKEYPRQDLLKAHVKTVHEQKACYKCRFCDLSFMNNYRRVRHEAADHKCISLKYECTYCSKTFPWRPWLAQHIREVHFEIKKYECSICGKKFNKKYDFTRHLSLHDSKTSNFCSICKKSYSSLWNLKLHLKNSHGDAKKNKGQIVKFEEIVEEADDLGEIVEEAEDITEVTEEGEVTEEFAIVEVKSQS